MFIHLYVYGCVEASAFVNINPALRSDIYMKNIHVHIYTYLYLYLYTNIFMFLHLYVYGCEGASAFINRTFESHSVSTCIKVCKIYEYIYIHIYVYLYLYMYNNIFM